jgi:hypothetical protein
MLPQLLYTDVASSAVLHLTDVVAAVAAKQPLLPLLFQNKYVNQKTRTSISIGHGSLLRRSKSVYDHKENGCKVGLKVAVISRIT